VNPKWGTADRNRGTQLAAGGTSAGVAVDVLGCGAERGASKNAGSGSAGPRAKGRAKRINPGTADTDSSWPSPITRNGTRKPNVLPRNPPSRGPIARPDMLKLVAAPVLIGHDNQEIRAFRHGWASSGCGGEGQNPGVSAGTCAFSQLPYLPGPKGNSYPLFLL
jgi:hypothetical protein